MRRSGRVATVAAGEVERRSRTRARAPAGESTTSVEAKRRKLEDGGPKASLAPSMQLQSRRGITRNSISPEVDAVSRLPTRDRRRSLASDHGADFSFTPRCSSLSSNGVSEGAEFADPEKENIGEAERHPAHNLCTARCQEKQSEEARKESRSMTSSSEQPNGRNGASEEELSRSPCLHRQRSNSEEEKSSPTEAELEEFFSTAEKKIHEECMKRYNFDFVNEKPLEGRYRWVKSKH